MFGKGYMCFWEDFIYAFHGQGSFLDNLIGKILLMSSSVINVPTGALFAVETKGLLFLWLVNLNDKSNVCKQISSLHTLNIPDKIKDLEYLLCGSSAFFSCRFIGTVGYR